MAVRDNQQRDLGGSLMGIGQQTGFISAPILNAANDNQHGTQLTAAREGADFVACIQPQFRGSSSGLTNVVFAGAALGGVAGWLYIVAVALLDNLHSLLN